MKKLIIMLFLCLILGNAYSMEFLPAFDINGGLTYPTIVTGDSSALDKKLGAELGLAGSFMMNTDFLPQLWFIPTLTANYSSTAQPLLVEDQRFIFSQWLDIYFSGGFNYQFSETWEMRLRGLYRLDYAQQTADEKLGKGLYDYNDRGVYLENSLIFGTETTAELIAGFKYIDKKFPNYQSLSGMVNPDDIGGTLNAAAKSEKDNLSYSAYLNCDITLGKSGWYPVLGVSYDYIRYLEQNIIKVDGTLSDMERIDRTLMVQIDFPYYPDEKSGADFAYALSIKNVSQNYYDSLGTPDPADDLFIGDYYNCYDHVLRAMFMFDLAGVQFNSYLPTISIGINLNMIAYTDRYAKNAEGAYTASKQFDLNLTPYLEYRHKLMDFWSYYINVTFARYNSNYKWEAYGSYNYTLLTVSLGTALSF